jgi:hypothetical protein
MMRLVLALSLLALGVACGISPEDLESYDVTINPTQQCTLTGSTSRDCADPTVLAQQHTTGRWTFEHAPAQTFTLTNEDGFTLPGIWFYDDATVLNQAPCVGANDGSLCYFARRKFESTDPRDNGCTKFGELVAILLRTSNDEWNGIVSDTSGTDQDCGTSTVVQNVNNVSGKKAAEDSLARQEAAAAEGAAP